MASWDSKTSTSLANKLLEDVWQPSGICMAEKQESLVPYESGVTSPCQVHGVGHRSLILMVVSGKHAYVEAGDTIWQQLTVQRTKNTPVQLGLSARAIKTIAKWSIACHSRARPSLLSYLATS